MKIFVAVGDERRHRNRVGLDANVDHPHELRIPVFLARTPFVGDHHVGAVADRPAGMVRAGERRRPLQVPDQLHLAQIGLGELERSVDPDLRHFLELGKAERVDPLAHAGKRALHAMVPGAVRDAVAHRLFTLAVLFNGHTSRFRGFLLLGGYVVVAIAFFMAGDRGV